MFIQFFLAVMSPLLVSLWLPGRQLNSGSEGAGIVSEEYTAYPDSLPGTFTGGFGEETCRSCHFDFELNNPSGSLSVEGINTTYDPGSAYDMRVVVESEHLAKAGFQMTARFEDGSQAGSFQWTGERLRFTYGTDDVGDKSGEEGVRYLQHSVTGTAPTSEKETEWEFEWKAPQEPAKRVLFHISANAGNDDFSPFGDWIYQQELVVDPASE